MKTKTFDAVAMKHAIQEEIYRETAGLTPQEEIEHAQRAADALRKAIASDPRAGKGNFKALFEALEMEQERRGSL